MSKTTTTIVEKTYVDDVRLSDVNHKLLEDYGVILDDDSDYDEDYPKGCGCAEGTTISITDFVNAIEDLKSKGATHLEMNYHEDHVGYDISGYKVRVYEREESKSLDKRQEEIAEVEDQIAELSDNLEMLRNKLARLHVYNLNF